MIIPPDLNNRSILDAARFYRDTLHWTVHALYGPNDGAETERGKKPVERGWKNRKREDVTDAYLVKYFGNGHQRNVGLLVQPPHLVIDLDSKADAGSSVMAWIATRPELAAWPRERTTGGVHLHILCQDIPADVLSAAGKNQKVEARLTEAVNCELFLGGNVALAPSVHKSGTAYHWEVVGPLPSVPWQELERLFALKQEAAKEPVKRRGKNADLFWVTRFNGDLATLDIVALATAMGRNPRALDADTGKHAILCPWTDGHTTPPDPRNDSGTVIFEARAGKWPGFKCLHTSHGEKTLADFLNWCEDQQAGVVDQHCRQAHVWEEGQDAPDGRPRLLLPGPNRPQSLFAEEAGEIVGGQTGPDGWYVRHDAVVEVTVLPVSQRSRSLSFAILKPVRAITLIETFAEVGALEEDAFHRPIFTPRSMGKNTAETLLHAQQFKSHLPTVDRILDVPQPILKPDGTIGYPKPGYDPVFRTFLNPDAPAIRPMVLGDALACLRELFGEFCLADLQAFTHAVAAFITPFCRGLYGWWNARTPVWLYKANRERAGKDYLANLTSILYEGRTNEDAPLNSDEDETRKKITAALLAGRRRIHWANCRGHINNASFEMLATASVWTDRYLGENREATLPNELEISLSANTGITYTPDFANRCRTISLHYSDENANARRFSRPDLHGWLLANRDIFVSALAALVDHWNAAGRPPGPSAFTSFPIWARVVGGIMTTAGMGDPCLPEAETSAVDGDQQTSHMKALFALANERHGEAFIRKDDVYEILKTDGNELFSWLDLDKKTDKTRFGMLLHRFKGRTLGGIRLTVDETSGRSQRFGYQFQPIQDDAPGPDRAAMLDLIFGGHPGHPGHPYNPSARDTLSIFQRESIKRENNENKCNRKTVARVATVTKSPTTPFRHVQTRDGLAEAASCLAESGAPIALDIETYGPGKDDAVNPWKGDIRLLTLAVPSSDPILLDLQAIGYDLGALAPVLSSGTIIGHNLKFDALWLRVKCGLVLPTLRDTMTASRLLTAGRREERNSLEAVVQRHLGVTLDKSAQTVPWGGGLAPAQLRYAAADVAHLHALDAALTKELTAAGLTEVFRLEMELLPYIVDMEARGFPVDRATLQRFNSEAEERAEAATSSLQKLFGIPDLNPGSPPQLKAALAAKGVAVASTGEAVLLASEDKTYIPAILAYRSASKRAQQTESLLDAVASDGRIHARFEPTGTDTGRFSSRDPNLQNVERGPIRTAFAAPEGFSLIVADYSQIELRVAAAITEEPKMIEAYRNGIDLHRLTAALVLEKDPAAVTKEDRQLAKAVNFGLLYGQSARGLVGYAKNVYGVEMTEARSREIRDRFFSAYPKLKAWQDASYVTSGKATETRTVTGRRQLLPQGDEARWPRFASSLNTPIQGGSADGIKRAIILIAQRLPPGCGLISTVHDELIALAPVEQAEQAKTIVEDSMKETMATLFPTVPVEVECAVCRTWGEKK